MILIILIIIAAIIYSSISGSSSNSSSSSTSVPSQNERQSPKKQPIAKPIKTSNRSTSQLTTTTKNATNNSQPKMTKLKCSKCNKRANYPITTTEKQTCENCGWKLEVTYVKENIRLAGVTYEGRQDIIATMSTADYVSVRRDRTNPHDSNAVGIHNGINQNIGWIPRETASRIAPMIDSGMPFYAKINQILGGNGLTYGVEVLLSNDSKVFAKQNKNERKQSSNKRTSTKAKEIQSAHNRQGAVPVAERPKKEEVVPSYTKRPPEYDYLNWSILDVASADAKKEVLEVMDNFIMYKEKVLPHLNKQHFQKVEVIPLVCLFENAIMLAGGRESNFVVNPYKAILVQLSYQLGFLFERLFPGTPYASLGKGKMGFLSTMDVHLETKLLQSFFDEHVNLLGDAPPIADTSRSSEVHFWHIDEIAYVLQHLPELGYKFKLYLGK